MERATKAHTKGQERSEREMSCSRFTGGAGTRFLARASLSSSVLVLQVGSSRPKCGPSLSVNLTRRRARSIAGGSEARRLPIYSN